MFPFVSCFISGEAEAALSQSFYALMSNSLMPQFPKYEDVIQPGFGSGGFKQQT